MRELFYATGYAFGVLAQIATMVILWGAAMMLFAILMIGVVGMLLDFAFASLQRMVTYVE